MEVLAAVWRPDQQCSAVLGSVMQCSAVQCSADKCSAVKFSAVQYSTVQYSALLVMQPPDGGQYSHGCHMVKVSPPPSGQSGHTALCVS